MAPRLAEAGHGHPPLLHFGGLVVAFDFIGYLNYRFDDLLVGWFLGPTALGDYDKAYQFLLLPINRIGVPVSGVAQSALSTAQSDPSLYRASLRRSLLLTTGLGMPLTAYLCEMRTQSWSSRSARGGSPRRRYSGPSLPPRS